MSRNDGLAENGPAKGAAGDNFVAAEDSSQNDKVTCGELYKQGFMSYDIYKGDLDYQEKYVHEFTKKGYLFWAKPFAKLMRKSKVVTNIAKPFGLAWEEEMAYRVNNVGNGNKFGAVILYTLAPICTGIGAILKISDTFKIDRLSLERNK